MARKARENTDTSKMRDVEAYTHDDKKRTNNPPVGMAHHDKSEERMKTYSYDPNIDPSLQWAGKAEGLSFDVPTSSIHIHESIKPHMIIDKVMKEYEDVEKGQYKGQMHLADLEVNANQRDLFGHETPAARMRRRREAIEFYQHGVDWTNRMIAGDSLVIMNSLLEKEGMAGQVQMVYFDPPYGITYGSNFQPFVGKKDVKDRKDEDLSQEPEMIKAFRDTWELGIHSYLSYLRNRITLARDLLSEEGSIFIQISNENLHYIRNMCDEIFGHDNFVEMIAFRKKNMTLGGNLLEGVCDYLIWYVKNKDKTKFHKLFLPTQAEGDSHWNMYETSDGNVEKMTADQINNHDLLPKDSEIIQLSSLYPAGSFDTGIFSFEYKGKKYNPPAGRSWKTHFEGMQRLAASNRLYPYDTGDTLRYKMRLSDYPVSPLHNVWSDTAPAANKIYVVQTGEKVVQRCILMTTDPGDLVMDLTCGSGTTAYVAEQWGRRWITCDTSRVAITLAKQRLMTATYDFYRFAHEDQGVGGGFIYKTVPHITLKSIANNEPADEEVLYDQPEIDRQIVRISGPFTVEALPAPVVKSLDDEVIADVDYSAKQTDWKDQLLATGILGRGGERLEFSRVETLTGTKLLQAEAETNEEGPRRAVICFAGETKPMDSRMVAMALDEAENMRPSPEIIVFAAFQFDPEAAKDIAETNWPGKTLLQVQMNTDLMTDDLKKKRSSDQSFWLVGQPDVELILTKKYKSSKANKYKVVVHGFDYYDVKKGVVESGSSSRIAMWMLDTDYDGMCISPTQVFFPMGGKNGGWNKLAKTLRTEIDKELIEQYSGNESLEFTAEMNSMIAVKIIDDRGIESLKVIRIGED